MGLNPLYTVYNQPLKRGHTPPSNQTSHVGWSGRLIGGVPCSRSRPPLFQCAGTVSRHCGPHSQTGLSGRTAQWRGRKRRACWQRRSRRALHCPKVGNEGSTKWLECKTFLRHFERAHIHPFHKSANLLYDTKKSPHEPTPTSQKWP